MAFYSMCGLTLESDIAFPELAPAEQKQPDCAFRFLPEKPTEDAPSRWFHYRLADEEPWLSIAKYRGGYLLRFSHLADFYLSADASEVRCYPATETPLETIRHLFLDQVIPMILSHWGRLVLHASAVVTPKGSIVFVGEAGRGKSTLTASFSQQGFPILTDDCLVLEEDDGQLFGIPSYAGLRLWPDSIEALFGSVFNDIGGSLPQVAHYADKKRLGPSGGHCTFSTNRAVLRRIYILAAPDEKEGGWEITIEPIKPKDAFMELVKHSYRLGIPGRKRLKTDFENFGRVAASLDFFRLVYPRDHSLLPVVQEKILKHLDHNWITGDACALASDTKRGPVHV